VEDLLGIIQGACHSTAHARARARAALKYIMLGLSSHMDDILGKYKVLDYHFLTVYLYMCLFICGNCPSYVGKEQTHHHWHNTSLRENN
ncbi:hypothetical protein ES288_D06G046100v1, partial [Gossypium darwinii]